MNKEKFISTHALEPAPHLKDFSTEYYIGPEGELYTWNLMRGFQKHILSFKQYLTSKRGLVDIGENVFINYYGELS